MNVARLVLREVRFRKFNFILALLATALAVVCFMLAIGMLRAFQRETTRLVAELEENTKQEMAALEDQIRKQMKGLGFNIYIFPKDQDMGEVYSEGYASKTMPEAFVNQLAESKIVTVNHLLPSLTRKMKWEEQGRTVLVIGVRGEVPIAHRGLKVKGALLDPVEPGTLVLGHELHQGLGLKAGDTLKFNGTSYRLAKAHPARGSVDDITIWMNLGECQKMLDLEGRINAIQALECNCATLDRLGEIRAELMKILPDTQIIEVGSKALARAEARVQAGVTAQAQIAHMQAKREALAAEREGLISTLIPVITMVCMIIVGVLTFGNVRDRTAEIGMLRAVGVRSSRLLSVFLGRALLIGVFGALLGGALGWGVLSLGSERLVSGFSAASVFTVNEFLLVLIATPLMACLAAWMPSLQAARKDPATILRYE